VYGEPRTQFEALGFLLRDNLQEVCVPVLTYVGFILLCQKKKTRKKAPLRKCQDNWLGRWPMRDNLRACPDMTLILAR
jgi:hypothetical protein